MGKFFIAHSATTTATNLEMSVRAPRQNELLKCIISGCISLLQQQQQHHQQQQQESVTK